jgi:RNA polymerase sigma-70 factor (ECF subfamily)
MDATKNPLTESSAALVKRIASGDQAAEEELVRTFSGRVYAIAVARTRDREVAHDLTQDVLVVVIKALRANKLREADKLEAFIQGTLKNVINNYFRTKTRRSETGLNAISLYSWDGVLESEAAERRRFVQQDLEQCDTLDQQIMSLCLVDGLSLTQVAKRLGISYDVVRARKSRLVRKMAKKFGRMSQK